MSFKRSMLALALGCSAMAASAADKIGVVNIQSVIAQLPQAAKVTEALKKEFGARQQEMEKLRNDIAYNLEKNKRDAMTMSEQDKKDLEAKIIELRKEFQTKGQALQQELRKRQGEEQNKLLVLVKQAIDKIAKDEDYDFVLHAESAIVAKPDADISNKVIEQVSKLN